MIQLLWFGVPILLSLFMCVAWVSYEHTVPFKWIAVTALFCGIALSALI